MKKLLLLSSLLLTSPSLLLAYDLSQTEKMELKNGGMIKKVEWKEGYIWPEVTIYTVLNHRPDENLKVFLNFESHKTYIPDMLESKIVKKVSDNEIQVYFEMDMPWPVNKSTHTTNNVITHNPDGSHTLTWSLVKADMLKSTDGHMTFSPYEGKTLLTYVSLIVPNSSLASMFKDRVAKDVEKSVKKISQHLTKTLNKQNSLYQTSQKIQAPNSL